MLFISYAHEDGADLAQRLYNDLKSGGRDLWIDRSRLRAGASWSADIEQAIDRSEVVLALLSPGSFVSDICRGEQLRALRQGKRVIVLVINDDTDRPVFLETKHYISFDPRRAYGESLAALIAEISGSNTATLAPNYRDTYVTAPRLPANVVLRPEELQSLRENVLRDEPPLTIGIAAVIGMGGIGKTTLAQMLCHDRIVQDAYPDGIVWISLGKEVADLVPKLREVGRAFADDPKHYDTLEGASNRLRTILRKKAALIVLDDVWRLGQVEPFLADARGSSLLITTRMHDISVSLQARRVALAALSLKQSLDILSQWTQIPPAELPVEAEDIVRECGRLPLALAMLGGLIHSALLNGRSDAWATGLHRLKEAQLDRIAFPLEHYPYPELQRAIHVSVEAIDSGARDRYLTMSVFPEEVPVPECVLSTFWECDKYDMQSTIDSWLAASLARRDEEGRITLHDLQLDYVRRAASNKITALHQQLVDRYSAICSGNWSAVPNDGYFFQRIAWHMAGAENWKQLSSLLLDSSFIRAKLDVLSYVELRQDFQWSSMSLAAIEDPSERRLFGELESAVYQMAGFVNRRSETSTVDRWFDSKRSRILIIQGRAGMGKTMLLRHIWVRRLRESILLNLSMKGDGMSCNNFLRQLAKEVARAEALALPEGFTFAMPTQIMEWLVIALKRSSGRLCVLVDEIDEVRFTDEWQKFLHAFSVLNESVRFILACRPNDFTERLTAGSLGVEFINLDGLGSEDIVLLLKAALLTQGQGLETKDVDSIVEMSKGNPFHARLVADALNAGAILEDLLKPPDLNYLMNRVIKRVITAGVPAEVLRTIAILLINNQFAVWEDIQEISDRDRVLEALGASGIFVVEETKSGHIIRASHAAVVESLGHYYQPESN